MSRFFIGTSGWNYPHWKGLFYPEGLNQNKWLQHYVNFFNSIELNVTFYRLIKREVFVNWHRRTPEEFYFVAKGSRFITHIKRLKDCKEPLDLFITNCQGLKEKLAAILWQLPPSFKMNLKTLEVFLKMLVETGIRQVFEFRNESWFGKEVYELLKKNNVCLCIAHSGGRFPCVKEVTADFLYLRFHGGNSLYSSKYRDKELKNWAEFAKKFKNKDIFTFFNNDAKGFAVKNALKFRQLLEKR